MSENIDCHLYVRKSLTRTSDIRRLKDQKGRWAGKEPVRELSDTPKEALARPGGVGVHLEAGGHQPRSPCGGSNPSPVGSVSIPYYDDFNVTVGADGGSVGAAVLEDISPKSLSDLVSASACLDLGLLSRSDSAKDLVEEEGSVLANLTTTSADSSESDYLSSAIELLHGVDVKVDGDLLDYLGETI